MCSGYSGLSHVSRLQYGRWNLAYHADLIPRLFGTHTEPCRQFICQCHGESDGSLNMSLQLSHVNLLTGIPKLEERYASGEGNNI